MDFFRARSDNYHRLDDINSTLVCKSIYWDYATFFTGCLLIITFFQVK